MVQLKRKVTIKVKTPQTDAPEVKKPQPTDQPPLEPVPEKGKKRTWLWALLVAVVIIIALLAYKGCGGSTPAEVPEPIMLAPTGSVANDSIPATPDSTVSTAQLEAKADEAAPATMSGGKVVPEKENAQPSSLSAHPQSTEGNSASDASIESKAKEVIRGIYGNGRVRKDRLGASYSEIQSKVNEMYRQGLVK